jgi:hypothetical protein
MHLGRGQHELDRLEREREWLSKTRTADAAHWNLLADMRPEQLSYVR